MFHSTSTSTLCDLQLSPKSYDFAVRGNCFSEGSIFEVNIHGRVVGAHYATGAAVKINEKSMIVRADDWSLWFADCEKRFHPVD